MATRGIAHTGERIIQRKSNAEPSAPANGLRPSLSFQVGHHMPDESKKKRALTSVQVSKGTGIVGNALVFLFWLLMVLSPHPSGKILFGLTTMVAIPTFIIGFPSALISFRSHEARHCWIWLILSLSPFPFGILLTEVHSQFMAH